MSVATTRDIDSGLDALVASEDQTVLRVLPKEKVMAKAPHRHTTMTHMPVVVGKGKGKGKGLPFAVAQNYSAF